VSITFELEVVPSSSRVFAFTTSAEWSSFTLSDSSSTQVYHGVYDGKYEVTLPSNETEGYDVAVSCVGTGSPSITVGDTTTFNVANRNVKCTFSLTGEYNMSAYVYEIDNHIMF
jgi:hypothetical protein